MRRNYLAVLALLLSITLFTGVSAQSGRNRKTEPTKPEAQGSSSPTNQADNSEEVLESRTAPGGETVEGDVIRFDTSLVTLPVTVLDRSGRYVPTMRRQDFHLFEDGVEQKITYFATVDSPFTVVLLIDTSGSTQFRLEDIQDAAINFVSKLKPADSVMVMSFDDRIDVLTRPTTDREVITRAIKRTRTGGGTRLYDAVHSVIQKQLTTINGRKAVVLFTDGVDTTSRSGTYDNTLREAEESDAPIFSLDYDTQGTSSIYGQGLPIPGSRGGIVLGGGGWPFPGSGGGRGGPVGSTAAEYRRATAYLHALSNTTGGQFYSADSLISIGQAFTWIAEELGRQYSVGYYPRQIAESGQRRQIKIKVNQPDLIVKTRDSYIYANRKPSTTAGDKNAQPNKKPYSAEAKN